MAEDSWMENERKFFVDNFGKKYSVDGKILNKVLKKYNEFLQKALIGESPYVAEDLKLTILESRGDNVGI